MIIASVIKVDTEQNIITKLHELVKKQMNTFLPKGYKAPQGSSTFMKLQEGANRFRIMSDAVIGYEGWKNNRPFRREGLDKNIEDDEVDINERSGKPAINHFWAFKVWDYAEECPKLLEITQKTIMKGIQSLVEDADWGDPTGYDISVTRVEKPKVSYTIKAYPPKAVTEEIQAAMDASDIDPQSLFKDPEDMDGLPVKRTVAKKK